MRLQLYGVAATHQQARLGSKGTALPNSRPGWRHLKSCHQFLLSFCASRAAIAGLDNFLRAVCNGECCQLPAAAIKDHKRIRCDLRNTCFLALTCAPCCNHKELSEHVGIREPSIQSPPSTAALRSGSSLQPTLIVLPRHSGKEYTVCHAVMQGLLGKAMQGPLWEVQA